VTTSRAITSLLLGSFFAATPLACNSGGGKADGGKADGGKADGGKADGGKADGGKADGGKADGGKADEGDTEGTLAVAVGDQDVEGPVPPDTSAVFFVVEGALLPLGCFDSKAKKLAAGDACLDMVPAQAEVRVSSIDTGYTRKSGDRVEAQCTEGDGKKNALAFAGAGEGANYKLGAWPPSAIKMVKTTPESTLEEENLELSDDEKKALLAAIGRTGEIGAHQIAEVQIDANDTKDKIYSVWLPDPQVDEQYAWSGIFLAMDGKLDKPLLLETSKSKKDVFELRGTLDLDGDKTSELWLRQVFPEGSGDRIVRVVGGKANGLAPWTCGV
jgi:hypothetical protein